MKGGNVLRQRLWIMAAPMLLAACAPATVPLRPGTRAERSAQEQRAEVLGKFPVWRASGRIGVSDGKRGGSGGFEWTQDGAAIDFILRAPITGRSFRLQSGPDGACLSGLKAHPVCAFDAATLLRAELGWELPMADLRAWVLGIAAADAPARLAYGPDGLPAQLVQDGWVVQYRSWHVAARPVPMPALVVATRRPYTVRLYVERWRFDDPVPGEGIKHHAMRKASGTTSGQPVNADGNGPGR